MTTPEDHEAVVGGAPGDPLLQYLAVQGDFRTWRVELSVTLSDAELESLMRWVGDALRARAALNRSGGAMTAPSPDPYALGAAR